MNGRRLTQLGARVAYLGVAVAVLAGLLGNRPLLLGGAAVGLLPVFSMVALVRPDGKVSLILPRRLQAGAPAELQVHFTRPGQPSAPDRHFGHRGSVADTPAHLGPLAAGAQTRTTFKVIPVMRGVVQQVGVHIEARDPLGLAVTNLLATPDDRTRIVHPAVVGCPALPGTQTDRVAEFAGLRGWQSGDQPRDVDWRATARRPGSAPAVRLWEEAPIRGGNFSLGLIGAADPSTNERIAELAAAALRQAIVRHDTFTLRWAGGEQTAPRLEPLLDVLALHPRPAEGPSIPLPGCDLIIGPITARRAAARVCGG